MKPTLEATSPVEWTGSPASIFTADLTVTFAEGRGRLPGRCPFNDGVWNCLKDAGAWQLWLHQPCQHWQGYPLVTSVSGYWTWWLLGDLYPSPGQRATNDQDLAEVVVGDRSADILNGHFLLVAYHGQEKEWHVWTDRFGTLHAYYATDGRRAAFGTHHPAVTAAASGRQLDWPALTGFFGFGFFPGDRTHFQDVRILRPASHYRFNEQGRLLEETRYWQWWHTPNRQRSYEETLAEFGRTFETVMTTHAGGGRIAVPISGGLDSRSTVAALTSADRPPAHDSDIWAYSYGYTADSAETRIARQVAQARHLPFEAITIRPYLFEKLDLILAWTEGFQDITQCRQASIVDQLAERADYLIAALWGDVWLDDMGLGGDQQTVEDDDQLLAYTMQKMVKRGRTWLLANVCRPQLGRTNADALLREMVQAELGRVQYIEDPDFRVKAFKAEQWSFRWSLPPIRVFQAGAVPRLVFYDTRLTDLFCTVPSAHVAKRRLQIDYLKRYAPDLADITWQKYDANLFNYQHFNSWLLPKRALKKAHRIMTRPQIIQRNWELQFLNDRGRQGLSHWLTRPGLPLHEFVSPGTVQKLLADFYAGPTAQRGYAVSMLLTFSAWLERYG